MLVQVSLFGFNFGDALFGHLTASTVSSILSHFLDHGFSGWGPENWVFVVSCPTNSTDSSAIYKLTIGLEDYLNFKGIVFKKSSIHELVFFTYADGQKHKKIVLMFVT